MKWNPLPHLACPDVIGLEGERLVLRGSCARCCSTEMETTMRNDASGWQLPLDDALIARYTASGDWPGRTLADFARALTAREPDRVTHVFEGQRCTVGRLLAAPLQKRGLVVGDVVSFQLPNWREAVVIDLATTMLGLVVAPIVPIYRDAEVAFMLTDAGVAKQKSPGIRCRHRAHRRAERIVAAAALPARRSGRPGQSDPAQRARSAMESRRAGLCSRDRGPCLRHAARCGSPGDFRAHREWLFRRPRTEPRRALFLRRRVRQPGDDLPDQGEDPASRAGAADRAIDVFGPLARTLRRFRR